MKTLLQNNKTLPRILFVLLLAFVFLAPALNAQTGHWPFNSTFNDTTTNGLNGTPVGSPTFVNGVENKAVSLNGSSQYITVADNDSLDFTTEITLAAWIKPEKVGTQGILKKAINGSIDGYELSLANGGKVFVRFNGVTNGETNRINSSTSYPSNGSTWMHVAATYDGTNIKLYINGIQEGGDLAASISIIPNTLALGIGVQPDDPTYSFKFQGSIDDARVYDYALSLTAIEDLASVVPPIPILDSPADMSTGIIKPPTLSWFESFSADTYQLQVAEDAGFSTIVYDESNIATTSTQATGLADNTLYYWRVNATNTEGTSDWSTVWSFTTFDPPTSETTGAGYSLDFDGINDYVDCGNNASANITDSITLEAWVYPSTGGTLSIIKKNTGSLGYELFLSASYQFSFRINGSAGPRVNAITHYDGLINQWTHVAATYDGTDLKIYINGVWEDTLTAIGSISTTSNNLLIGNDPSTGGRIFEGRIDEVRLWNVARTETQIQENMCKKLTGSQTGLVSYWQFSETNGTIVADEKAANTGSLMNSDGDEHARSGAAVGDDVVVDYSGTNPGDFTASVSSGTESITATGSGGTITGLQVYRVDASSSRSNTLLYDAMVGVDDLKFWGIKVYGTSPTYYVKYIYTGNPNIVTESALKLAYRSSYSDTTWSDALASLNETDDSLTLTGQSGTEYTLGSTTDPLPVELSAFSAKISKNNVLLKWRTETEVSNYGFEIQRSSQKDKWDVLGFVPGNGNSNSPKDYSFTDDKVTPGKYSYRLKQIDTDGQFSYSKTIQVNFGSAIKFELSQNYPNPFNPVTTIQFSIPQSGNVKLTVYNILGEQVAVLVNEFKDSGIHTINFDAGQFNSGLYVYKLESNGFVQTRKMLLVK